MRVRDLSLRLKLFSLIAVSAAGFAAFIVMVSAALEPDVDKSAFADVVMMQNVIADVLPPPKNIIEPYLTLLQVSYETDPAARDELLKAWGGLEKAFEDRQLYWERTLPESSLKQALEHDSTAPAREFFALADKELIPAIRAEDHVKVRALLTGTLRELYRKHHAAITDVATDATRLSQTYVASAASAVLGHERRLTLLGVGIVALCGLFGWLVSRSVTRRIGATVAALDAVAAGDLSRRIDDDAGDELGRMARALNAAVDSMSNALGEVQTMSHGLTRAASELSASAESIASGAHEQAASLEETAASLEEITATVRQSSDNAQEANQLATGSRQSAERGGGIVSQANTAMTEIHDSSDKIGNIITTIDEIAFQTNILALNAAVEAARAGEQGRGFAVVAAQVGTLSQRSSDAAKEIKGLIQDSVRKVASGSALVSRSGQSLQEIVKSVTSVTDLVGEMAAAFREQSTGLDQISTAVAQMDEVMNANSSQTDALSATAGSLTEQAEHLRDLLGRFRLASEAPDARRTAAVEPTGAPRGVSIRLRGTPASPPARPRRVAKELPAPRAMPRAETARAAPASRDPAARPSESAADTGLAAMDGAMMSAANGTRDDPRSHEEP